MKPYIVSLILTIFANSEEEAQEKFIERIETRDYDNDSLEIEE